MWDNIRSALSSIWGNKLRSLLTLLGVVIGVASVTTLVALGQGLKKDVSGLIEGFGTNVIVVVAGKLDTTSKAQPNPADFINGDILTQKDVTSLQGIAGVSQVSPVSLVSGALKNGNKTVSPTLFGVYPNFLEAVQLVELDQGHMINSASEGPVIVLSQESKVALFGDTNALGQKVSLGKEELTGVGILGKEKSNSVFSSSVQNLSLIPFDEATVLNKSQVKIVRIITKAADTASVKSVKEQIHTVMLSNHAGEENFSVLTQDDILGLFDQFLNLATAMVSAIAAISLVVGGIGIMNIMLVTVTERTREIGLGKAIGATRGAILVQFLTEAVVITAVGGLIGLGIAFLAAKVVAYYSPLKPEFSLNVIVLTVGISIVIGVIFGLWPALRAAKKDPIEALRYE